ITEYTKSSKSNTVIMPNRFFVPMQRPGTALPLQNGVVPVLYAPAFYKKHILVVRHIARRENIGVAGLQILVNYDAITKVESTVRHHLDCRLYADSGDDQIAREGPSIFEHSRTDNFVASQFCNGHRFDQSHSSGCVIALEKARHFRRKQPLQYAVVIQDHGYFDPLLRKHSRHFHAYETATNHDCMLHFFRCVPDILGIVYGSQVKQILKSGARNVQGSRMCTGGDNKLLKPE